MTNTRRLDLVELIAYGAVSLPLSMIGLPLVIYLAPFYVGAFGLPLGLVGGALVLARFSDIVVDPVIGYSSDHTRSRFGRRKIWMVAGGVLLAIGSFFLFNPAPPVTLAYFLICVAAVYFAFTLINVPYEAWGAELSVNYHERTRIAAARQIFNLIGLVAATLIPAIVLARPHAGTADVLFAMMVLMIALLPLVLGLAVWKTPAKSVPGTEARSVRIDAGIRLFWRNGPFKRVMAILLIATFGETFRTTITVFYLRDYIGLHNIGLVYLMYFAIGLASIPIWTWISRRIEKHKAMCLALILAGLSSCLMLGVPPTLKGLPAFLALFALKGFCFGSFQLLPAAMLADVVDLDTVDRGAERQGLYFALSGMVQKAAMALGQGLSLNALALFAYSAAAPALNGPAQLLGLRLAFSLAPAVCFLAAAPVAWGYTLTATRHSALRAQMGR